MQYRAVHTVDEAVTMLAAAGNAKPIAGGTDLAVVIADGLANPEVLLDISGIPALGRIRRSEKGLAIGAAVTIAEIASRDDIPACLVQGARSIGSPQIRNLATIGGNVCNASPCGDTLAPLLALDAAFVLASAAGSRTIAAEEFFLGPKKTVLGPGELLVEILIGAPCLAGGSAFRMIGKRNGQAISQVNAAVWLAVRDGHLREVRAAVGSVAPVPLRLRETEKLLRGSNRAGIEFQRVLETVDREIAPITDVRASVEYRRRVTGALFREALLEALAG
jgi:carbon-monoxide dehydrogenase medium subunit